MFYSQKCFISKCLVCVYVYILNLFTPGYSKNNAKVGIKHQSIKLNDSIVAIDIYIIQTITSFSVRIGLTAFLRGSLFVYEGYIATSYVTIVDVIYIYIYIYLFIFDIFKIIWTFMFQNFF